jgi:putative zinc- or iron-chelating protein
MHGRPPGAIAFEAELAVLADSAVHYHDGREAAAAGTTPEELVGTAFERAVAVADAAETGAKARAVTACRKGCAWCCHQNVRVSAAEVFHLARWLRNRLTGDKLAALAAHAQDSAARLRGMPQPQRARARIACALLDPATGVCRAHEARPLLCRGQLSLSAETCRRAVESPGEHHFEPLLDALHGAGLASMSLELEFSFLGGGPVSGELTAMLAVALADPTAEARWFRGENPFPRHTEFSAHLNSRMARMLGSAWARLAGPASQGRDELRAAAVSFLRDVTGAQ